MNPKIKEFFANNSGVIGVSIIIIAFMAVLVLQASATSQLQRQLEQEQRIIGQIDGVTKQISTAAAQRTQQINELNDHLDCIAKFFTVSNRTYVTIDDIDSCSLRNTATGEVSNMPTANTSASQQGSSTVFTPAPANSTSGGVSASTPSSSASSSSNSAPAAQPQSPGSLNITTEPITTNVNGLLNGL